jgi:steroid 5-alpha reductase family enzyme
MNILNLLFSNQEQVWGLPALFYGFFLVALIVSAVGFFRLVYFVSVGYGLSIAAMGILSLALFRETLTLSAILHAGVLTVYGLRLGGFLLYRDFQTSYRSDEEEIKRAENISNIPLKLIIWISCALLYATMFTPVLFHMTLAPAGSSLSVLTLVGVLISLAGLIIESLADWQKNRAKLKAPKMFVSEKLFRLVRQPNYFGEILVWTGSFVAGLPFYAKIGWAILAAIGYICIFLIMLGSAKRLELKQERRYGGLDEFQKYTKSTPLLFPFVPVYSLQKWKITLG